jgi:hypothetical protein
LARLLHPDKRAAAHVSGDVDVHQSWESTEATIHQAFLSIKAAWETLRDESARASYDATLRSIASASVTTMAASTGPGLASAPVPPFDVELSAMVREELEPGDGADNGVGADEEGGDFVYTYACRCGDVFELDPSEKGTNVSRPEIVSLPCSGCSLKLRVLLGSRKMTPPADAQCTAEDDYFSDDNAEASPGEVVYCTGDIGRWHPDGPWLQVCGRADDQLKVNGRRIEAGEVEQILLNRENVVSDNAGGTSAPLFSAAAVVSVGQTSDAEESVEGIRSGGNRARLAALLVPTAQLWQELTGHKTSAVVYHDGLASIVRHRCSQVAPSYLIPSVIAFCASLPMTRTGKVDRHRLPELILSASASASSGKQDYGCEGGGGDAANLAAEAREAPIEIVQLSKLVCSAWEEVLGLPRGSVSTSEDDFLSLGGDSLLALRVSRRLTRLIFSPGSASDGAKGAITTTTGDCVDSSSGGRTWTALRSLWWGHRHDQRGAASTTSHHDRWSHPP